MAALYRSYVFKAKDPAIDELRTVIEDHLGRRITKKDSTQIANDGGPKAATMNQWFFGNTLRPQSATLEAAGRALGYRRVWQKMKTEKVRG
jgi:hypothetical protein